VVVVRGLHLHHLTTSSTTTTSSCCCCRLLLLQLALQLQQLLLGERPLLLTQQRPAIDQ